MRRDNPIYKELVGRDPIVQWLLPGLLPQGAFVVLAGLPAAGKSLISYTIGTALAAGVPVLGLTPPEICRVLYFDQENGQPDRVQYERWAWHGLGCPDLGLVTDNLWVASFELGTPEWANKALEWLEVVQPNLIIYDTTTPCFSIEEENDNGEAARAIASIRELADVTCPRATSLTLKHARAIHRESASDESHYTLRGAKTWEAQCDSIVYASKMRGRPRRDGLTPVRLSPGKVRAFGLRHDLYIDPQYTPDRKGIQLRGKLADVPINSHEDPNQ